MTPGIANTKFSMTMAGQYSQVRVVITEDWHRQNPHPARFCAGLSVDDMLLR